MILILQHVSIANYASTLLVIIGMSVYPQFLRDNVHTESLGLEPLEPLSLGLCLNPSLLAPALTHTTDCHMSLDNLHISNT